MPKSKRVDISLELITQVLTDGNAISNSKVSSDIEPSDYITGVAIQDGYISLYFNGGGISTGISPVTVTKELNYAA